MVDLVRRSEKAQTSLNSELIHPARNDSQIRPYQYNKGLTQNESERLFWVDSEILRDPYKYYQITRK